MPGHADSREALIRAAFDVARVVNAVSAERGERLIQLFDDIAAEIARVDPTGPQAVRFQRLRMETLLARVEELTGEAFTEWHTGVRTDMARLGRAEGLRVRADLIASLGPAADAVSDFAPTQNMMKAILDTSVFGDIEKGMETLEGWGGIQEQATLRRVRQQLQLGLLDEDDIATLVARVRGGRAGGVTYQGVADLTRRQAEALVRTAATHVTSEARMLTFEENARVVKAVKFVASLDSKTCLRCAALDGKTWPLGSDDIIRPPVHIRCRCTPVTVQDWEALGLEPPETGERAARDLEGELAGKPRSQTRTQVSADTTYEAYLRRQPASVQDEILGPRRGKLFRNQEIRLDQMVGDERRILTLDELERRLGG